MNARTVASTLAALLLAGCGISGNFRHDAGYAAFDAPSPLAKDRELGISLGPLPLAVARLVLNDEAEIKPILKELRAVRVYSYDISGDAESAAQHVHTIQSDLVANGWLALITVNEDDEHTAVLLRPDAKGHNRGLAVLVQDAREVILVNLIGNIRLDLFTEYMAELDVETPKI